RSFDREGLAAFVRDRAGGDAGDALRVYKQLWQRGVERVGDLRLTRKPLRERLDAVATVSRLETERILESADGTRKYLWRLHDGHVVESVLIPDADRDGRPRLTLCMSSQVG